MIGFSNFFKSEESSVLGIDIGSSAIKIIQLKKQNGQAVLETYGELALGPYAGTTIGQAVSLPPEKISQAINDLLNEKEVNATTRKCGFSIPFSSSFMSVIEMPQVSAKQLAVMVPLEARKYIPAPISEVVLDWSVIPKSDVGPEEDDATGDSAPDASAVPQPSRMEILVVAIHKDTVARYQQIAERAALEAGFFEIEIFSTMRSVLDSTTQPVMIMDMGAASTKVYILERGVIRLSHTINRGAQDITTVISKALGLPLEQSEIMKRQLGAAGEDKVLNEVISLGLDYIFGEANRILLTFEKKYNKAVSEVIMVGGGAALKGLSGLAQASFKTTVRAGDPFSKVAAPAFLEKVLRDTAPEFAVSIGSALRKLSEND
jgi:type IV pilus assembly protein PilM